MKIKDITYIGIMAAVLCIVSPFSVMLGLVPISLATLGVYLSGGVLGKKGGVAVLVYVALGLLGLPVFSGFEGGFSKLAGVTGGYILGYIPCAFIVGIMTEKVKSLWAYPVSMLIGTVLCYIIGTAWFVYLTKTSVALALLTCVLPFLAGDIIKIIFASVLSRQIKKHTGKSLTSKYPHRI